ncbi:MAG TPA: RsmD family RNA methyltransferase [Thermoleophilia bacterium]|nr:RsmD family RNA methyltransferase [Thermoleophilia bacterium]
MRVVGGAWRGRRLLAPSGRATRPTADNVREAIFNVLASLLASDGAEEWGEAGEGGAAGPLAGRAALDLFAGSGALGIEALSRGAASCTFVERAPAAVRALRENLARVGAPAGAARVRAGDFRRVLKADAAQGSLYNLVLVDAPYAQYAAVEPVLAAALRAVLAPRALVVVETASGQGVHLPLVERSVKLYGDTRVTFLSEV